MLLERSETWSACERNQIDIRNPATPLLGAMSGRDGAIAVAEDGRVLELNAAAGTIIAHADALTVEDGRIRALRSGDDAVFQVLLAEALKGVGGGPLLLSRRWGARDYFVMAKPLPLPGTADIAALLVITDPERVPEPSANLLRHVFGLTAAESQAALRLLAGRTLGEAAKDLGLAGATLRAHLAHIFRKTKTRRQAELIRLLMSYPWDEAAIAADVI